MHFNSSVTPSCGIAAPRNMTQTEEFKPLLACLELVLYLPLDLKEQLTAMNVYMQNTGDTVHMRKNAAAMGEAKSLFHKELLRLPLCIAQSHWEVVKLPQIDFIYLCGPAQCYAELPAEVLHKQQCCQHDAWSPVEQSSPAAARCSLLSPGTEHMGLPQGVATGES